eukprot:6188890-Pleurochrysis_carterae.AAC.2
MIVAVTKIAAQGRPVRNHRQQLDGFGRAHMLLLRWKQRRKCTYSSSSRAAWLSYDCSPSSELERRLPVTTVGWVLVLAKHGHIGNRDVYSRLTGSAAGLLIA